MITDYVNNDGWFDDIADGPIRATLTLTNGERVEVEGAWFLSAPPAYAPEIINLVTLYDTLLDVFVRELGYRPEVYDEQLWNADHRPDYDTEIRPLLERGAAHAWVVAIPPHPHELQLDRLGDSDPALDGLRTYYLDHLRSPDQANELLSSTGVPMMPYQAGDNSEEPGGLVSNYLTLTRTQHFMLRQWAAGKFIGAGQGSGPSERGGAAIDRGVLENCVGGAFGPGIEMSWISREPRIYAAPFRIKARPVDPERGLSLGLDLALGLEPGDLTRYMAQPWHADFNECSSQPIGDRMLWWWPAQRPLHVRNAERPNVLVGWVGTIENQNADDYLMYADDLEMVEQWSKLGFVVNVGTDAEPRFVQVEKLGTGEG
ncbi:MAG: hypothetical protein HC927_08160 [Deltaproteobacteria bacterium]|nr:hypothetical protein [Deltaproteobacteria bacterium]